jgi:hypothetical protein
VSLPVLLISLALLALVVLIVGAPLRTGSPESTAEAAGGPAEPSREERELREELEAEREAKYREIRDAELDFRTGKLSQEDYRAIDGALRTQALEILNRLDEIELDAPGASSGDSEAEVEREESAPARLDG